VHVVQHALSPSGPTQSEAAPAQEQVDADMVQEVIMALDMRENSTMGCAFFSTCDGVLQVSEGVPMAEIDMVEQFLIHAQPTTCLVCGRAPETLRAFLEKASGSETDGERYLYSASTRIVAERSVGQEVTPRFIIRALPSSEFCIQSALEMLLNLPDSCFNSAQAFMSREEEEDPSIQRLVEVVGLPLPRQSDNMKLLRLASRINIDSTVSVSHTTSLALNDDSADSE
jgi:DNA mismatch repair protein MSH5